MRVKAIDYVYVTGALDPFYLLCSFILEDWRSNTLPVEAWAAELVPLVAASPPFLVP